MRIADLPLCSLIAHKGVLVAVADPTIVSSPGPSAGPATIEGRSPTQLFWLRFKQDRVAIAGGIFLIVLILLALLAPVISSDVIHHGPNQIFSYMTDPDFGLPKGPDRSFLFGADSVGRDVLVRTMYGLRTSLVVAFLATGVSLLIGIVLGLIAAYYGGAIDTIVSRSTEIVLALPLLLLSIGIATACGQISSEGCFGGFIKPGLSLVVFIIALFSWPYIARLIRGFALSVKEKEFIEASRSMGAGNLRIMRREMLPSLVAPIIIYGTLMIPSNILFEAYLSFLGIGIPQTTPSWGRMISEATSLYTVAWWLMFFPGMALILTTLAFNLLGDGLRDALDPRTGR